MVSKNKRRKGQKLSHLSLLPMLFAITACGIGVSGEKAAELTPGKTELIGAFQDSTHHSTSGQAAIVQAQDGTRTLQLTNFETDNGPALEVWVSESTEPTAETYVSLGKLTQTSGDHQYALPADLDLGRYRQVLIWCEKFSVLFGSAELQPVRAP